MVRILRPAAQSTATTSLCNVIIPEKIERPVDTKDWKIDPHEILSPYMRYSVAAMYAIGSISENQSENYRVLSVGLGGDILNAHLRHSKNNVNSVTVEINPIALELSKKYFGFEKDDRQQCIIQDGAQYVQEAAKRGERFHCILIDACVQGVGTCPALVFLNESVVASYPKILHETGILIVNYLMRTETLSLEYMLTAFKTVFEGCIALNIRNFLNKVVICVRSRNQLKLLKSNEFNEKIADLMRKFWKERQCEPYCI